MPPEASAGPPPISARDALMAQLLEDVDMLFGRLEAFEGQYRQGVKDGVGQAVLSARMNFAAMIDEKAGKLTEAGRAAAAQMASQCDGSALRLASATQTLEQRAWRIILPLAAIALVAGILGGYVGAKLALIW